MNKIMLMNVSRQYEAHKEGINNRIQKVLSSGNFISSKEVERFEKRLSKYNNIKNAVTVGNGTDALIIALRAIGIKKGDEVIVPAMSFFATSEAIVQVGATPIFVDINKDDFTIDVNNIEKNITKKTKAVIPVHLYGRLSNMKEIITLSKKYNFKVVEDACQSIGAVMNGIKAGSFGDVACISFFPTKNLGAYGDGGVILTDDNIIATRARALRVHGSGKNGIESFSFFNDSNISKGNILDEEYLDFYDTKYNNSIIGYNSRLDELQAAILDYKLDYLDEWNQKRIKIAQKYHSKIKNDKIFLPQFYDDGSHVYYVFPIIVKERRKLIEYLDKHGISTGIYFPIPLHLQPAHNDLRHKLGDYPNAEWLSKYSLTIPLFPELTEEEVDYVIEIINKY